MTEWQYAILTLVGVACLIGAKALDRRSPGAR